MVRTLGVRTVPVVAQHQTEGILRLEPEETLHLRIEDGDALVARLGIELDVRNGTAVLGERRRRCGRRQHGQCNEQTTRPKKTHHHPPQ